MAEEQQMMSSNNNNQSIPPGAIIIRPVNQYSGGSRPRKYVTDVVMSSMHKLTVTTNPQLLGVGSEPTARKVWRGPRGYLKITKPIVEASGTSEAGGTSSQAFVVGRVRPVPAQIPQSQQEQEKMHMRHQPIPPGAIIIKHVNGNSGRRLRYNRPNRAKLPSKQKPVDPTQQNHSQLLCIGWKPAVEKATATPHGSVIKKPTFEASESAGSVKPGEDVA